MKKIYSYDNALLDEALVVSFEENKSFTNEQMAELHIHGSIIVIKTVMETLSKMPFLRQAYPGEFTQRALENNKLNLTQVEGLSDLLQAETEYQQKQALDTYTGKTNKKIIIIVANSYFIINFVSKFPLKEVFAIFEKSIIGISTVSYTHLTLPTSDLV